MYELFINKFKLSIAYFYYKTLCVKLSNIISTFLIFVTIKT